MACVHNQAKIDQLNSQIRAKKEEIGSLRININKCNEIKNKHMKFNEKMDCVINNLEGNYVVNGVAYDHGKMSECLTKSNETILDCDDIITQSKTKIALLEIDISNLESEIASLQGDCSECQAANV